VAKNDPYSAEKKLKAKRKSNTRSMLFGKGKKDKKYGGETGRYWVNEVKDKMKVAKDYRSYYYDKNWMINWAYYLGLTNLKYNRQTGNLDWDNKDPLKYNINEIYSIVRAVRGAVTRTQPIWDVDAYPYGDVPKRDLDLLGNYLTHLWDKLGMKKKVKEMILHGLICGIGILQHGYDEEDDNGTGEVWVDNLDPFDVYIDPNCDGDIQNAKYIIKVVRRYSKDIEQDPMYINNKDISADNKYSASEYKDQLESKVNPQNTGSSPATGTSLIYEVWFKKKVGDNIVIISILPEQDRLIRYEETDKKDFPFVIYQPDINPNKLYSEGWVKNLVPLQRALNYLERSTLEYNVLFSKGKYVTTPDSNVKIITNQHGQIVKKARGSVFEQLDMKPMSSTVFKQQENIMRYLSDVGASNEAFMGKTPTGIKSGIAIEALVANNMVNLADLSDNLVITLSRLGTALLKEGYEGYNTTKEFRVKGEDEVMKVIGMGDQRGLSKEENIISIPENPQVRVVINSGIAYTKQGRQEILMNLRKGGDIDRRTLLEDMGNFDVDQVEARLMEERQGMPITENGMEEGAMVEGGAPGAPEGGLPQGMDAEGLADFLEARGLQLDSIFDEKPELLVALLNGELDFEIVDGMISPKV